MNKPLLPAPDKNGVCRPPTELAMALASNDAGRYSPNLLAQIIGSAAKMANSLDTKCTPSSGLPTNIKAITA
jgi:hypothetical protein